MGLLLPVHKARQGPRGGAGFIRGLLLGWRAPTGDAHHQGRPYCSQKEPLYQSAADAVPFTVCDPFTVCSVCVSFRLCARLPCMYIHLRCVRHEAFVCAVLLCACCLFHVGLWRAAAFNLTCLLAALSSINQGRPAVVTTLQVYVQGGCV